MSDRVFVLGAGGFIGRALCLSLASRGWEVLAGTRRPVTFGHPRIDNIVAPFNDIDHYLPAVQACGAIIHAASHTTPSSSAAQPQLDGNLRATLALIEALQALPGRRLTYLSSGGALYQEHDGLVDEDTPLRPRSYHGAGKVAAEQFIQAWTTQYEGIACVLRPSNVYGPGQHPRQGFGIIPAIFECIHHGSPLQIWGNGRNVRDYLYIDDLVSLCILALDTPLVPGTHVFNASSGQGIDLLELLARVEQMTKRRVERDFMPPRTIDMRRIVPDNARARSYFNWAPQMSLDEGLKHTWLWFGHAHD